MFNSLDTLKEILQVFTPLFKHIRINRGRVYEDIDESLFSVDIVDFLIKKGLSYREAHDVVGRLVKDCLDKARSISSLSEEELKSYCKELTPEIKDLFKPEVSVKLKISFGGTNPQFVQQQIKRWQKRLKKTA